MRIIIKHHMLNTMLMGLGGSEYVAFETVIGLRKHGIDACIKPLIGKYSVKYLSMIKDFYGIPYSDYTLVKLCSGNEGLEMNITGDFLSGKADIYYFHYPSMTKPLHYYPGLREWKGSLLSYFYYLPNRFFMNKYLRRAKLVIANTRRTAYYIEKEIGVKTYVVYPPVNTYGLLDKPIIPPEERGKYFLSVARISPEKQPYKIIYVAWALKKLGLDDWKIILVGGETKLSKQILELIHRIAEKLGVNKYIEIKTNVHRRLLNEYYRKAYGYIHLTDREHFGITIIEAMAAGTPVIIPFNNNIVYELDSDNKYLYIYRNSDELVEVINKLISDTSLYRIHSAMIRRIAEKYTRERFHERIYRVISKIIDT